MTRDNIFCRYCGKKLDVRLSEGMTSVYCPFCRKRNSLGELKADRQQPVQQPQNAGHERRHENSEAIGGDPVIQFKYGETAAQEPNSVFRDSSGRDIFRGWLPAGFAPSARAENNGEDADAPLLLWAFARNSRGKKWFYRSRKNYSVNKLVPAEQNVFKPFDSYLDENAVSLLGTNNIRVIKRVASFDETKRKMQEQLAQRKAAIEAMSGGNNIQFVVQGEYGAEGGKLYEAAALGKTRYLLLHTIMLADEYSAYSPMMIRSQQRSAQILSRTHVGRFGMGMGMGMPMQMQAQPFIDTDPNVPFGRHRAEGVFSSEITWNVYSFSAFLSDTLPSRGELVDFYRFVNSLTVDSAMQSVIEQLSQQTALRRMQDDQQAANIVGQMIADQNRSFDRRRDIMNSLSEHRERLFEQQYAASNADFDRRSRLTHESIMGVDTYAGIDGRNVEADISIDRVFQHNTDTDRFTAAGKTADVPFDRTELQKLK